MADKKKKTADEEVSTMDKLKKAIDKATDLASLKIKYKRTAARRKDAYVRLGELAYALHRPRRDAVPSDISAAMNTVVDEITHLSQEMTELSLRIELLKADP